MDDDKKNKKEEAEKTLSGALDRDHDGGILDNLGGFLGKVSDPKGNSESSAQEKSELLDKD